jgi:hypothetical protein
VKVVTDERILCGLLRRIDRIDVFALSIRDTGNAEELEVSRQGRLRHLHPFLFQPLEELFLAVDLFRVQNAVDETASRFLTFQSPPPFKLQQSSP